MRRATYGVTLALAGMIWVLMSSAPGAQRGRRGNNNANQGLPLATNTIRQHPEAYYGKQVTVSAGVDQMLSTTAFTVDQWRAAGADEVKPIGKPILVVAPYLTNTLDRRNYLVVRGELVKFDLAAMARVASDYKLDLGPDLWAKYQGQPMLLAASVLNSTYKELARKPIPPPTAQEASLSAAMKSISPAFADLRNAGDAANADLVASSVAKLLPAFDRTEAIWDDLGQSSAGQWARDAHERAATIGQAAAAGDWGAVKASAASLNQLCATCHGTYREREDDGTFRIKPGTF
jgi:hypothetical protein